MMGSWDVLTFVLCHPKIIQHSDKYLQALRMSRFWDIQSFHMFTGSLLQINLQFLITVLLGGFQSSLGTLKSTEYGSAW